VGVSARAVAVKSGVVAFTDSLRGYSFAIHQRDGFCCVYCGWDGSQWPNWLFLCQDHLRPKDHPQCTDPAFIVTACQFCNYACNRTPFEGETPAELVAAKKKAIERVRESYRDFWEHNISEQSEDHTIRASSDL
jgi:hypothetical protein